MVFHIPTERSGKPSWQIWLCPNTLCSSLGEQLLPMLLPIIPSNKDVYKFEGARTLPGIAIVNSCLFSHQKIEQLSSQIRKHHPREMNPLMRDHHRRRHHHHQDQQEMDPH